MTSPAVSCVIPAYQAEATIAAVLGELAIHAPHSHVIVVDDGSTDRTSVYARSLCETVLRHDRNLGKGQALRTGIDAALNAGADLVVTLDADGQHPPALVPALVGAAEGADVVIGARSRLGTSMPWQRRTTNALSSGMVSLLAGQRIADSQSGFRAYRRCVLEAVTARGDGYELETDLLVRAARAGFRIGSVPVPTVYGSESHFHPVRDTARVVGTLVRLSLAGVR